VKIVVKNDGRSERESVPFFDGDYCGHFSWLYSID
jgi:hypothetical protein